MWFVTQADTFSPPALDFRVVARRPGVEPGRVAGRLEAMEELTRLARRVRDRDARGDRRDARHVYIRSPQVQQRARRFAAIVANLALLTVFSQNIRD